MITVIENNSDILLVAPHAHPSDDINTDIMTIAAAEKLKCNAVINGKWSRKAYNCNNIKHCEQVPVCNEFLTPIRMILHKRRQVFIMLMHGMGNAIRQTIPNIDLVVGYGNGIPPRYTCDLFRKDCFVDRLSHLGLLVYEGAQGGRFSAHNITNLSQALHSPTVQTMQVEVVNSRRYDENAAAIVGYTLADGIGLAAGINNYIRSTVFNCFV